MIRVNKAVALRMESCIKQTHIEVTKQYSLGQYKDINGGSACFAGYDSFLSQVVGWGFSTQPKHYETEIEHIENFYDSLHHSRIDIELCPFVGNDLVVFLSQRGYGISELNNVSLLALKDYKPHFFADDGIVVKQVSAGDLDEWSKRAAQGFGYPEAQEQFFRYAHALGTAVFAAYEGNKIIAVATVALHGDVGDMAVASTLPAYRRRGLQKRLLNARLEFMQQKGAELATVTTAPGTISDL
ncbi:MAG: GNAT family N-acetyltransferase, partial [bacterium]|nr:GNAT family N-acetyltransferase [bacterium]